MAKVAGEFLCPSCGIRLRIHQPGQQTAEIDCPECSTLLTVEEGADRELVVTVGTKDADPFAELTTRRNSQRGIIPAAILLLALIIPGVFVLLTSSSSPETTDSSARKDGTPGTPAEDDSPPGEEPVSDKENDSSPSMIVFPESWPGRLEFLGEQIGAYRKQEGKFPPTYWMRGEGGSFSWLAGLDPSRDNAETPSPDWDRDWNSSANDRFVRRARPDLMNPDVDKPIGADRYPASHVVGISGLGRDAAELPKSHPRAGIFGWDRTTRVEDVTDGLSQTWMAGSVQGKLSSWANGSESIRSLTAEPYLNGPDGFGAGDSEQMPILMADGSVRTVTAKTDPRVIRRMAAMADGLPLDSNVAGEPGQTSPPQAQPETEPDDSLAVASEESTEEGQGEMAKRPTEPPEPARPDRSEAIASHLQERILAFELNDPTPLNQVLVELEGLLGVPLEFDPASIPEQAPLRTREVTLKANRVTLEKLLAKLLAPLELTSQIDRDRILIREK